MNNRMLGRSASAAFGTIVVFAFAGCGGPRQAAPVNPDKARAALKTTLDAWKSGQKPDDLRKGSPAITAQDMDWMQGFALIDYQLEGDGQAIDANLLCPVKIVVKDDKGRETEKKVKYTVGTDPVLTVFREIF